MRIMTREEVANVTGLTNKLEWSMCVDYKEFATNSKQMEEVETLLGCLTVAAMKIIIKIIKHGTENYKVVCEACVYGYEGNYYREDEIPYEVVASSQLEYCELPLDVNSFKKEVFEHVETELVTNYKEVREEFDVWKNSKI